MKKISLLCFSFLVFLGCERDIGIESLRVISGYQIDGRVIDRIRNPIPNVDVIVFYNYEYVDYNSPPSKEYDVPASGPTVTVVVQNREGQTIRTLYTGNPPPGPFVIDWNKQGATSGTYSVHYLVNNVSQKSYDVTVDRTIVARTDSLGRYTVPDENLPVGFYPVPVYSSNGTFYGNHRISPNVGLYFVILNRRQEVYVAVFKNRVTIVDVVFE